MMRDSKLSRRNSGKNLNFEETENVPVNVNIREPSVRRMSFDSCSRPPFNSISEPFQNPSKPAQESKSSKPHRTPTKAKMRYQESAMPMRTPEKQGVLARDRFGWGHDSALNTPKSCRTPGRASLGFSELNSTHTTPTKTVTKPPNPGLIHGFNSRPPVRTGNFAALSKGIPVTSNTCTPVNTIEVPHFDLEEDPSFWMDHNVQVLIRIRPLNGMEITSQGYNRCLKQESAQCLTWVGNPETRFTFDHVACETIDQETLFKMVGQPMVENCLSGYNSCMFAYGQTGSGKTHTMLGEINNLEIKPSQYRGMTPRIFEFLFSRITAEEGSRKNERLTYNCKCSFLEIYNEQITDLLDPSSTNLQLREDVKKGVYVENLTEFEVHSVGDILRLLSQGSANRRVASTNMNRESSRSHSVFTCVIESRWEKDSTSNLRFARLNLVDLAGSERQKSSGAEGERLKEAANINKSLSTLGHVIMVLVDGANARTRHVPYRDSRLTFLLQDSLGGNSKTMIIANVSPSVSSAIETLNTLKFAQRAKLIQNNAVINEDASGDVEALQHQIRLLKEELATLKRHNISRSLIFNSKNENCSNESSLDNYEDDEKLLRVSCKQLKSLETSLNGALRREQSTENCIKQLEAEIEQLNSLVRQREEENRCTKMMLKFREDKIQRMESLLSGTLTVDSYLLQENKMVNEENKILRGKVDRNPEVTRFAVENIRLLEQLRRFQEFYEEGEREMLLSEVNELRNQLVFLDEKLKKDDCVNTSFEKEVTEDKKEDDFLQLELKKSQEELEKCRDNLNSCMEKNEKLCKEIADLNDLLDLQKSAMHEQDGGIEVIKEPILEAPTIDDDSVHKVENNNEILAKNTKEVLDLQLEVEILKIILKEERLTRGETEEKFLLTTKQFENQKEELQEAKSVIEALDIQNLTSTNNLEDVKNTNNQYAEILLEKDLEIGSLKDQISSQELQDSASISNHLETKLRKMRESLEKAKRLNDLYQNDLSFHAFNEEQMDKVRKQVEIETTDVIVCLQEELFSFQQKMDESCLKEKNTQQEFIILKEKLDVMTECNNRLQEKCEESDTQQQELVILKERLDVLTECNNRLQEKCEESDTQQLVILKEKLDVLTECSKTLREKCAEKDKDIEGVLNAEIFLEVLKEELQEAKSVINAVEIQNLVSINHFEYLKNSNKKYAEILHEKNLEIDSLKFQISSQESQYPQKDLIILQEKLDAMTECNKSLREKYEERDTYQQELIIMKEELNVMTECNKRLQEKCEEKDQELNGLSDKIEGVLNGEMFQEILKEKLQEATSVINALEIQTLVSNNNLEDLKNSNKKFAGILHEKDLEITSLKDQISSQDLTNLKEELDVMTECNKRLTEKCEEKDKELFILSEEIEEVLNGGHVAIDDAMNYRHEKRECVSEKLQIISRNINEKELKIKELNSYLEDAKSKGIEMESMLRSLRGATLVISEAHQQDCIKKDQEISQLLSQIDKLKENLIEKDSAIEEAEKKIQSLEIESCCYFDRIKEADFMITELKKKVESYSILEEQFKKDTIEMMEEVKEIESMILEIKAKNQELVPKGSDFYDIIKACFHDLLTWHEEIWFEMIEKDWVVSVFHVCHMEKLMETVSGLNVEKGLLLNGLCESNSLVSELKGQNGKSRKELEAFSMLRWKLLVDIKNGFDRISRKEEETGKISMRVNNFEKKILELQVLEETMLENFNHMGYELFVLMKEMDMSNEKDEEKLVMDLYAKEIKLLIISSKVKEMISINNDLEIQKSHMLMVIEKFKEDKIVSFVDMQLKDWILMEKDSKIGDLKQEVEMQKEVLKIYSKHELEMENLELKSVVDEKNILIESLKEDLKSVSCEKDEINGKILEKEEELKVYEKSVEELECTVNVLENQVEMVKGDAERQRLQREEIELELHDLEQQIHNDSDMKRELDEKEKEIQDLLRRNIILEKEITELNQQKVQDKEYNQTTFKSMESTDDVSVTSSPYNILNSPLKRLDKSGTRSRGGGSCSPFKLAQQLKFEKNGEIFSARIRIEELEKEMVMLNAKNDELNEKIRIHDVDSQVKLNQQLDEFVVERQRSQDEIKRLQVALEQIDQQEQLLKAENEIFKTEIDNLKKNVMELEVAGQQNLQQQILHHAKIKEENSVLKAQNGEIGQKLKRAEVIIRRVKEELANLRETSARNPC